MADPCTLFAEDLDEVLLLESIGEGASPPGHPADSGDGDGSNDEDDAADEDDAETLLRDSIREPGRANGLLVRQASAGRRRSVQASPSYTEDGFLGNAVISDRHRLQGSQP